jgi:hypothetical protein
VGKRGEKQAWRERQPRGKRRVNHRVAFQTAFAIPCLCALPSPTCGGTLMELMAPLSLVDVPGSKNLSFQEVSFPEKTRDLARCKLTCSCSRGTDFRMGDVLK